MELLIVSFLAGILTVLAPCVLPLLPVIIGGSLDYEQGYRKALVITASLCISLFVFTLLLKASTALLGIDPMIWQLISGLIVVALGLTFIFPRLWEPIGARLNIRANQGLADARQKTKNPTLQDVLTGIALGPIFSSCSPTYALIVASVLPSSLLTGLGYLAAYMIGLSLVLLLIAVLGQKLIGKLGWLANPKGWFKKTIGVLFIVVGVGVIFGLDKVLQTFVLESGLYDPISEFEINLFH